MAVGLIARFLVFGTVAVSRAVYQAYRQALINATKTGVAQETIKNTARRASRGLTEQESRQILGVHENSAWEEILKKYNVLFENNAKNGSFYMQSKIQRAKECLESVYQNKGPGTAA